MSNKITKPQFLTVTQFADAIGVHEQTVRVWDKTGRLKPHHKTPSGRRMYSPDQVEKYFNNEYVKD